MTSTAKTTADDATAERASGVDVSAIALSTNVSRVVLGIADERRAVLRALRTALVANDDARALDLAREITGLRDGSTTPPR